MLKKINLYKLEQYFDDPRYEGFHSGYLSLYGFSKTVRRRRLGPIWKAPTASGRVRKFNDYPCLNWLPAFSPRAVDALSDLLEANGELLPFRTSLGKYYYYNVFTEIDALHSRYAKVSASGQYQYQFAASKLKGATLFRLPQDQTAVYVTDIFVNRANEHGLNGMNFVWVWPMPPGMKWWKLAKEHAEAHRRQGVVSGRDVKAQSIMIDFSLAEPHASEMPRDTRVIKKIMKRLDDLLAQPASTQGIGAVEGYESLKGKLRIVLSCPDADELERVISPLLARVEWSNFKLRKRRSDCRAWAKLWD